MKSVPTLVQSVVEDLRKSGKIDRATAEARFGTALRATTETQYFQTYVSNPIPMDAATVALELRAPKAVEDAATGSLLIVRVTKGCVPSDDVKAHYPPWTLLDAPRGDRADEDVSWTHAEPWGTLSYAYLERTPECVTSIVFDTTPKDN